MSVVRSALLPGWITILLMVGCSGWSCPAGAADSPGDNQTLEVSFFCLKPGNDIGASRLRLQADGTLHFAIEQETLLELTGSWQNRGTCMQATAGFTVQRNGLYRYRLTFDGFRLMGCYAGIARLTEYDRPGRMLQELTFLFYAAPPENGHRQGIFF